MAPTEADTATANFKLRWEGQSLEAEVAVPTAPISPRRLLPMIQHLTNELVGLGERSVAAQGLRISCRAGCGACCRQLVPIGETEARQIADLVEALPEPRQTAIRERFEAARVRLEESGMLARLRAPTPEDSSMGFGLEYFHLGIPCPFLEEENCSIHPDRPLSCREYLVTSPAEECRNPTSKTIGRTSMPGVPMTAFASLDGPPPPGYGARWVPLILALEWAAAHPEPPPSIPGTELFTLFMKNLTESKRVTMPGNLLQGLAAPDKAT